MSFFFSLSLDLLIVLISFKIKIWRIYRDEQYLRYLLVFESFPHSFRVVSASVYFFHFVLFMLITEKKNERRLKWCKISHNGVSGRKYSLTIKNNTNKHRRPFNHTLSSTVFLNILSIYVHIIVCLLLFSFSLDLVVISNYSKLS